MAISGGKSSAGVPKGYCAGLEGSEKAIRGVLQAGYAAIPGEPKLQPSAPAPTAPSVKAAPVSPGMGAKAGLAPPNIFTTMEKGPKAPNETLAE
jgi:hypothetical protein